MAASTALALWLVVPLAGCELAMSPEQRLARAERAAEHGDLAAAQLDLRKILTKEPKNPGARLLLAEIELRMGDLVNAALDLQVAEVAGSSSARVAALHWSVRLAERKYQEVSEGLANPLPGLAESQRLSLLGRARLGLGAIGPAREALVAALKLDPLDADATAGAGLARAAAGDPSGALAELRAVTAVGGRAPVQRAIGEIEYRLGHLPQSDAAMRAALKATNPRADLASFVAISAALADVLLAEGKLDDAAAVAAELKRQAPGALLASLLQGRVAAARRDYPVALASFQRVLAADPNNVAVRTMAAAVQFRQGNVEQAATQLQRTVAAAPGYLPARQLLAQVLIALGRPDDADRIFADVSAEMASSPDLLLVQARVALLAGRTADAVRRLEQIEQQGVPAEPMRLDLAAAYIQAGRGDRALALLRSAGEGESERAEQLRLVALATKDHDAAVRELQRYAAARQSNPQSLSFAALALATLGEIEGGRQILATAAEAHADVPLIWISLARVNAAAGRLDAAADAFEHAAHLAPSADIYGALAQVASLRGQSDLMVRWLESARSVDAKAIGPRVLLARTYLAKQQAAAAQPVIDELLQIAPASAEPHLLAAAAALDRHDAAMATQQADEAVRVAPSSEMALLGKGAVYQRLGRAEEARQSYHAAESIAPGSAGPVIALARLDLSAGKVDSAILTARHAQERPEVRVAAMRLEAQILLEANRAPEAVRVLERLQAQAASTSSTLMLFDARRRARLPSAEKVLVDWCREHATDVVARRMLAQYWQEVGDADRSIATYEELLRLRPEDPVVLNNVAYLYAQRHDPRALDTARHALRLAPDNPAIADTVGTVLLDLKQWDEALVQLRRAAAGAPLDIDIQMHLLDALQGSGKRSEVATTLDGLLRSSAWSPAERSRLEARRSQQR